MRKLVTVALLSLALPNVTLLQTAGDLAQKVESRSELAIDYQIVSAKIQDNQRVYAILQTFCKVSLPEPARRARSTYCIQKAKEFNDSDADWRAQLQKLGFQIRQLDLQIQQLQKARPTQ